MTRYERRDVHHDGPLIMTPLILIVSASRTDAAELQPALAGWAEAITIERRADLEAALTRQPRLIVVGARLREGTPAEVLAALAGLESAPPVVVLDAAPRADDGHAYHLVRRGLPVEQLRLILGSAVAGRPLAAGPRATAGSIDDARRTQRAFEASRRVAVQHELVGAEAEGVAQIIQLLAADRAHLLFHDGTSGDLWSQERQASPSGDARRAVGGLAGYTARTGQVAVTARAAADPRYLATIDDPRGRGDEHLLTQPVIDGETIHAVLVAVRTAARSPFAGEDSAQLAAFAALIGPLLVQLSSQVEARSMIDEAEGGALFRAEAVAARKVQRYGHVLQLRPRWIGWGYAALVAMVLGGVGFVAVGRVGTYSTGPAVVRTLSRVEVVAGTAGTAREVRVTPGQEVAAGDVLIRLDDTRERAELERLTDAFDAQLRNRMLAPTVDATGQAVGGLRLELERARAQAEQREVRATSAGIVGEIRVRPGQSVAAGDTLLSLAPATSGHEVLAFLPGGDRPQLTAGMAVRLRLVGFSQTYQDLEIDTVADEIVGPSEAQRYLGPQLFDSLRLGGPVVIVRARLPADGFTADGKRYRWHDGLSGLAEVRVRSDSVLATIIPAVKKL